MRAPVETTCGDILRAPAWVRLGPRRTAALQLLDTTAAIDTPERIRFRYRIAGPGQRGAAWMVDACIRAMVLAALAVAVALLSLMPGGTQVGTGFFLVALFFLEWFYGVVFETWLAGRTPGKLVFRLRVVRVDGAPGRFPDFVLRNLLKAVDFLPAGFGIGLVTMLVDEKMRRIGDLVAGTVVVAEEKTRVLGTVHISPPVSEEERRSLPSRIGLSPQERSVIETYLRRRSRLSDERAEELAEIFAPALCARTGLQAESWDRALALAYARETGADRA